MSPTQCPNPGTAVPMPAAAAFNLRLQNDPPVLKFAMRSTAHLKNAELGSSVGQYWKQPFETSRGPEQQAERFE